MPLFRKVYNLPPAIHDPGYFAFDPQISSLPDTVANWYPGHQHAAQRAITEKQLKRCDLTLQIGDARLPITSVLSSMEDQFKDKKRILVFNKADLADPTTCEQARDYYRTQCHGMPSCFVSVKAESSPTAAKKSRGINTILETAFALVKQTFKAVPTLLLVCGIPNVGKSTIINALRSRHISRQTPRDAITHHQNRMLKKGAIARTGAHPGVTRSITSIVVSVNPDVVLVDTPGIMLPSLPDWPTALKFGLINAIPDKLIDEILLAEFLLFVLQHKAPAGSRELFRARYSLQERSELRCDVNDNMSVLSAVARRLNAKARGGADDLNLAASHMLREYRSGAFGSFSLEDSDTLSRVKREHMRLEEELEAESERAAAAAAANGYRILR